MRSFLTLLLFSLATIASGSIAAAGDMVMLQPMQCFPAAPRECCLQPPWHDNVRAGACDPCAPVDCCPPACGACAPACDPCGGCCRLPSMFPRLHALFCNNALLCPSPPKRPQCSHCGAPIEGGL
ncbi:MAG: hypothetical protein ACKOCN_03560 [Planctomycetaceae bacterium]